MEEDSSHDSFNSLSESQKEKVSQFKDLSGFDEIKCFQILRANDWKFEVALDLALDGAYNEENPIMENLPSTSSNFIAQNMDSSNLRHRHPSTMDVDSSTSQTNDSMNNDVNERENRAINSENGYSIVIWNTATWILKLPFIIVFNTMHTLYDFFLSFIQPTLHYDPNGTVERFITEFEEKYGERHPPFHRGPYMQAVEQGKREIRFVLIYIHSSSYRDIDRFSTSVITTQKFIEFVRTENIIFWSCTVDYPDGYKAFQSLKASTYPFMALIGLKNHKMVVMKKIEGFHTLDSIIGQLQTAISNNEYSLIAARLEREQRDMASLIRAQQDAAFEESLKADQEKERKRKEEQERKEREERLVREKLEEELELKEKVSLLKRTLLDDLPEEPDASQGDSLRIMFKLPNGTRLERRFFKKDPVKYLYYFVYCHEENLINFKLRTNFPTCDLPGHSPSPLLDDTMDKDMNISLDQCNLGSNIVLFVHDLDS